MSRLESPVRASSGKRGLRRFPEMAVHAALGASRAWLASQALIEH